MAPPFLCWAASTHAIENGLNSSRRPFAPALPGTLNVLQFRVEPLKGASGPSPPLSAELKFAPVPRGMAKQLVHAVPKLGFFCANGSGLVPADVAPVVIVPGIEDCSGVLFSKPQ